MPTALRGHDPSLCPCSRKAVGMAPYGGNPNGDSYDNPKCPHPASGDGPMTEIKLPELKENVEAVEINAVLVKPGDAVKQGQPLMEVQADKAALDVPAPAAGTIGAVRVKSGEQVQVAQDICTLE